MLDRLSRFGPGFLPRWIVATSLGFIMIGFAFHFPGTLSSTGGSGGVGDAFFGVTLGIVSGAVVGAWQWAVLRHRIPRAGVWVLVSVVTVAIVHGSSDGFPGYGFDDLAATFATGVVGGFLMGTIQSLFFRKLLSPLKWVLANIIGWSAGLTLGVAIRNASGLAVLDNPLGWALGGALRGGAVGIILGLLTGYLLTRWSKLSS